MGFQSKLRHCRKKKGLTQNQLGEMIGMSGSSVRLWELGLRQPTVEKLRLLSSIFEISIDTLLDEDNSTKGIEIKDIKFRKSLSQLSPKGQQDVLDYLEYVRDREEKLQDKEVKEK